MHDAPSSLQSTAPIRRRGPEPRFFLVWAILIGSLVGGGVASRHLSAATWLGLMFGLYMGAFKVASLIALSGTERRQFTPGRLVAYFLWMGIQPRPFLRSYVPPPALPRPTWRSFLVNALAGAAFLWGVPHLLPESTPLLARAWVGLIGIALLRLFAGFDLWALIFRGLGFPVEKPFVNPAAATSLRDFWGRRWNRFMSGLQRDLLFLPLARWTGAVVATLLVFFYSGVLHEFVSVLAGGGYGGPTLYFLIQGVAFLFEGTRLGQRLLLRIPLFGRLWTALIVIGPIALVAPPALLLDGIAPILRQMHVPGLGP